MRKFHIREKLSRGAVLGIVFAVLFLVLLLRLFRLQIVEGESYAENFRLQIRKEIPVKGARGTIYDRNGIPLARDQLVYQPRSRYSARTMRSLSDMRRLTIRRSPWQCGS